MSVAVKVWQGWGAEPEKSVVTGAGEPPAWFLEEPARAAELFALDVQKAAGRPLQGLKVNVLDSDGTKYAFQVHLVDGKVSAWPRKL